MIEPPRENAALPGRWIRLAPALAGALALALAACAALPPAGPHPVYEEVGMASWYGPRHQGMKTASGVRFDMRRLTAAHRTLPFNTRLRVTNLANGRMVTVLVNDRGPYEKGRILDLSAAAARRLGMTREGVTRVRIEVFAADQHGAALARP